MTEQPILSDCEWALIANLLERERGDLSVEIRHTRTSTVREELHQQADMVRELLTRLKACVEVPV